MPDWILQLLGFAIAGGAGYAAIRADLARLHERTNTAIASATRAHERLDEIFDRRGRHA